MRSDSPHSTCANSCTWWKMEISQVPLQIFTSVRNLAQVSFILTGSSAKNLLKHILEQDNTSGQLDIGSIAKDLGFLAQGGNELEELCKAVIQKLPKEVESIRRGKVNVVMRLVGQVMKDSKGTADARKAKDILLSLIEQSRP